MAKEFKLFARDMTQAVQLALLLALCMIYLYNFRILQSVDSLPDNLQHWWKGFLIISNLSVGAFVTTAVCTRFVFPSISLEGQALWLLQKAPLTTNTLLRAKFWSWFVPVAGISSVVFTTGAFAIRAEPHIVALNFLTSWIICYGIVGLAIGLGTYFARFDWEHSSQLAASFGSLVYMLTSVLFIFANLIPSALLIFLRTIENSGFHLSNTQWYLAVTSSALLLMYINFVATRWALRLGESALAEQIR